MEKIKNVIKLSWNHLGIFRFQIAFFMISFISNIYWFYSTGKYESFVSLLILMSTIFAFTVDKFTVYFYRRKEILVALAHDNHKNLNILSQYKALASSEQNSKYILPKFYISAIDYALASGVFIGKTDKKLHNQLHTIHGAIVDFNSKADFIHIQNAAHKTTQRIDCDFINKEAYMTMVSAFIEYTKCLIGYSHEHGITLNTIMFED